ncbi:MAG: hypothetical protein U0S12_14830 [Fimbriimonadales bacterium]
MTLVAVLLLAQTQVQDKPYAKEIAEFKRQDAAAPPAKGQIVFIGSSSFTRWSKVGEAFPTRRILNRAFGGSQLRDVTLWLDDVVFAYEPRQVVLYCGENDFAADESLEPPTVVRASRPVPGPPPVPNVDFIYVSMKPSPAAGTWRPSSAPPTNPSGPF